MKYEERSSVFQRAGAASGGKSTSDDEYHSAELINELLNRLKTLEQTTNPGRAQQGTYYV